MAVVTRAACLAHYDRERVHGYCASCPSYGKLWSCPPFPEPPLERFGAWTHAVLVGLRVPLDTPEAPEDSGSWKDWAVARFDAARAGFRKILMDVEAGHPGATALVAGRCLQCASCTRGNGKPCCTPGAMRISLEAAGFDVSGLVTEILGTSLHWPGEGRPDHYLTVGALLCRGGEEGRSIREALNRSLGREAEAAFQRPTSLPE